MFPAGTIRWKNVDSTLFQRCVPAGTCIRPEHFWLGCVIVYLFIYYCFYIEITSLILMIPNYKKAFCPLRTSLLITDSSQKNKFTKVPNNSDQTKTYEDTHEDHHPTTQHRKAPNIITKTCLYYFEPLKPHFYIVKLGFKGIQYFSYICLKHRLWVLVRTAPPRRF